MDDAEKIATKVSRDLQQLIQLVKGNGTKKGSIVGRLDALETQNDTIVDRLVTVENYPCKNGCVFEEYEQEAEEMREKKRTWRVGDVANYIQLAVLFLIVYGMFVQ